MRGFLLVLFAVYSIDAAAQGRGDPNTSYQTFIQDILKRQQAPGKAAATTERLVGSDYWFSPNQNGQYQLFDSSVYQYSGIRSSKLSPYDDHRSPSYTDNGSRYIYEGWTDPGSTTLLYDTAYLKVDGPGGLTVYRAVKTYDAAGLLTSYRKTDLTPYNGLPSERFFQYTYDANGHCTRILDVADTSAGGTGPLVPVGVGRYITYSSGLKVQDSAYDFGPWNAPYEKLSYSYNSKSNPTQMITQGWNGTSWENMKRNVATYDYLNRLSTAISYYWQAGIWNADRKDTFGYSSGNTYTFRITSIMSSGSGWAAGVLYRVKLSSFSAMDTMYEFTGNGGAPTGKHVFAYTSDHHLRSQLVYIYRNGAYDANPQEKYYYNYKSYDAPDLQVPLLNEPKAFIIYPNPVSGDELHIQFTQRPEGAAQVSVFDMTGRRLKYLSLGSVDTLPVPLGDLPAGGYYLLVQLNGEKIGSTYFVKGSF